MRISVICIGKFHHFDLARQLHGRGVLGKIFTGYPRWKLRQDGLPEEKIDTYPWWQTVYMALGRYGVRSGWLEREMAAKAHVSLARYAARNLDHPDVLVALSGSGLEAARVQQARGGAFICDRASSHIRFQDRILREEFDRWGGAFRGVDPRTIERETAEYAMADAIAVPSEFVRRSFLAEGVPASRLHKVPFGVDLSRFTTVAQPAADEFQVLFVGQVSLRKGVPYLLEAFARLRHPRKKLVIIGSVQPEILPHLRKLDSTVQVLGARPQAELKQWMSRSHVMVLPSIEEGLAYVQAQAMACGCPVIGTTHSGAEDILTDGVEGFVVPIRDPAAILGRLEELGGDPGLRARLAEAGLERVRRIGGWDEYGRAFVCLARSLRERRPPTGASRSFHVG